MKTILHLLLCACICAPVRVLCQPFSLLKDINPGSAGSSPELMFTANGNLFFASDDGVHGKEVWKTSGIQSTTTLLKDINPLGSSTPKLFAIYHNEYYFLADDGSHGRELWKTDGTTTGTVMLKDINTAGSIDPTFFLAFKNLLLFFVDDGVHGRELWKTDGTTQGTQLIKDINPTGSAFDVNKLPPKFYFNSKLIFVVNDGVHGQEYWITDGTEAGTQLVKDVNPTGDGHLSLGIITGDYFYFSGDVGDFHYRLWKSDGTENGTQLMTDVSPAGYFTPFNGNNYLVGDDRTRKFERPSMQTASEISSLGSINGIGYAIVTNSTSGTELWVTSVAVPPISLFDFNGTLVGQDANLNLKTTAEEKNSMYVLERSFDRINFSPVTSFAAKNNPDTNSYQYVDRQIIKSGNTNAYYRIRQIGPNRRPSYSKIVDIRTGGGIFWMNIQPNPVQSQLNIHINGNKSQDLTMKIIAVQGIVLTKKITIMLGQQSISWDINKLAGGNYILAIEDGQNVLKEKFIKL